VRVTLAEALKALHKARRISAAWLPGMKTNGWMYMGRWGIACGGGSFLGVDTHGVQPGDPCLTDPATVGCLAALAREATGDPTLIVDCHTGEDEYIVWSVSGNGPRFGPEFQGPVRDTEGEAWAAVLIAAAGVANAP
jgi:hypothetical protein